MVDHVVPDDVDDIAVEHRSENMKNEIGCDVMQRLDGFGDQRRDPTRCPTGDVPQVEADLDARVGRFHILRNNHIKPLQRENEFLF
ncbi:hypothetical protein [Azospirillum formosense]|uniref:hypothetical protein n=1 Tax=Azospirillum formosense TaxID=861533 RepID=UPI003390640A